MLDPVVNPQSADVTFQVSPCERSGGCAVFFGAIIPREGRESGRWLALAKRHIHSKESDLLDRVNGCAVKGYVLQAMHYAPRVDL